MTMPGSLDQREIQNFTESSLTTGLPLKNVRIDATGPGFNSASTSTITSVNDTASSTTLLSSNTSRKGALFFNNSTSTLYIKFGTTASATSFTVSLSAGGYYEIPSPIYTGRIDGIWSSDSTGAVLITELT